MQVTRECNANKPRAQLSAHAVLPPASRTQTHTHIDKHHHLLDKHTHINKFTLTHLINRHTFNKSTHTKKKVSSDKHRKQRKQFTFVHETLCIGRHKHIESNCKQRVKTAQAQLPPRPSSSQKRRPKLYPTDC